MKRVVFVVDASPESGAGHVSRLLPIFEEFSDTNFDCCWVTNNPLNLKQLLDLLGGNYKTKKIMNLKDLNSYSCDILIADTYSIDFIDISNKILQSKMLVQIVDDISMAHDDVTLLVSGSILGPETRMKFYKKEVELVSGLEYFPLRRNIRALKKFSWERNPSSILLNFGRGVKSQEVYNHVTEFLSDIEFNFAVHVPEGIQLNNTLGNRLHFFRPERIYETVMENNSLLLCAGGVSLLESIFLNLRLLVLEISSNQRAQIDYLTNRGFVRELDLSRDLNFNTLLLNESMTPQSNELKEITEFDGRGAERLFHLITTKFNQSKKA